jgi:hypothetical protein
MSRRLLTTNQLLRNRNLPVRLAKDRVVYLVSIVSTLDGSPKCNIKSHLPQ